MRQQFFDAAVGQRRQPREHILQIGIRIMPIEPGRLDQAHHGSRPPSRPQRAREQPVLAPKRHRPDLVFDPVVVDRQATIVQVARERRPAFQAVIQGPADAAIARHLFPMCQQPGVQRIGQWPRLLLP